MQKLIIFLCVCVLFASSDSNAQKTKYQKWQKSSYFRGFNIKLWDNVELREVNQQDFYDLAATGSNLAMIQAWGTRTDTFPYGPEIWYTDGIDTIFRVDRLDNMVTYARNAGLYYVLCIRKGPGRQDVGWTLTKPNTIWTEPVVQSIYAGMLKEMVQRYLPDTLFVGLDMILEPNPGIDSWANLTPGEYEDSLNYYNINVNNIYKKCIDSIRLVAPDLPLLVEGVHWSHAEFFATVEKQADDKIVYNTRGYIPTGFLREKTMNNPNLHYPDNYWCWRLDRYAYFDKAFIKDTLFFLVDSFQQEHNVPIIVGEFGLSKPQIDGARYLKEMAEVYSEKGWHYAYWIFRGEPDFNYEYFDDSLMFGTTAYMETVTQTLIYEASLDIEEVHIQPDLMLFPNPAIGNFYLEFELPKTTSLSIQMLNVAGQPISSLEQKTFPKGRHQLKIETSELSMGVYFVCLIFDGTAISRKLIVIDK